MLVSIDTASTQVLVSTMEERMPLFTSIDRTFVIEAALCKAMLGTEGDKIMEKKIVAAFPSDSDLKKLDITNQELKIIKDSPVARCTGPAAASMLQAAVEVVEGMLRGCSPQQKFMTSGMCNAMLGTEGDKTMEKKIVAAFPSDSDLKKLDITNQELKIIKDSPVARCTGPAAASMLQAAVEVVEGMLRGCSPQQKFMTSGIMQKLSPKLPLFCQTTITIEGKTSIITGQAAMKELLKTIKAKKDDAEEAEALSFSDLEPLHAFQWLLNEAELLVLTSLTEELVSSVTAPNGSTKPPKGASKAKVSGGKSSKDNEDMAFADVMSLFT